ncbi:MAG: hypothetical protein RIG61_00900 [Deltaproteobacteria bacterium]
MKIEIELGKINFKEWFYSKYKMFLLLLFLFLFSFASYYYAKYSYEGAEDLADKIVSNINNSQNDKEKRKILMNEIGNAQARTHKQEIARHLALAFIIAAIVIIFVELPSEWRNYKIIIEYANLISNSVWKAISNRSITSPITEELDAIIKMDVIRREFKHKITFIIEGYSDLPDNHMIVRSEVEYLIYNLTGKKDHPYVIRSDASNLMYPQLIKVLKDGKTYFLPGHIGLAIDNIEKNLNEIFKSKDPDRRNLEHVMKLPEEKDKPRKIQIIKEDILKYPNDFDLWVLYELTEDLTINLENQVSGLVSSDHVTMKLNHRRGKEFTKTLFKNEWTFKGGLLPGQSYYASWNKPNLP